MVDHRSWVELAIPGASLFARCSGRSRVLMPSDAFLTMLNGHAGVRDMLELDLRLVPDFVLSAVLHDVLELGVAISDELDSRTLP